MFKLILKRLKDLQGENSVSSFARFLEMPQKTVDTYINGQRKPSVEFIMRVCSKCHVSADWLLGLSDDRGGSQSAAPMPMVTKSRQKVLDSSAILSEDLAAIRRELHRQAGEIAVLKQLNQPSATCCG